MKTIAVIGAGYVGLVTGACFAQQNIMVIMIEKDANKIALLRRGSIPFYEPGLEQLVLNGIKNGTIIFVHDIPQALSYQPSIIFSCVGTPSAQDGSADLSAVWEVADTLGTHLEQYTLIVNKSTVPVGTAQQVQHRIQKKLHQRNLCFTIDVASNPEFLKEGDAVNDFLYPDRIVVGTSSPQATALLYDLYKSLLVSVEQFICMDPTSAELTKYAANGMLATRISFMNQIAILADAVGADVQAIKAGIGSDKRIGNQVLNAGIGYGGSCFPKDVQALAHMGKTYQVPMTLIQEVDKINNNQRNLFINRFVTHYQGNIAQKKIGIWGLAFKPETDDIRCSPAIDVINHLLSLHATIIVYDPVAMENIQQRYGNHLRYATTANQVLNEAEVLIILTDWLEFTQHTPEHFLNLADKTIFDGRNCFDPIAMHNVGLTYITIGRNTLTPQQQSIHNNSYEMHVL